MVKELQKSVKLEVITIDMSTIRKKRENIMPEFLILNDRNKHVVATSGSSDNLAHTADAEADKKDNILFDPKNDLFVLGPIK
jgi:hypothetical protein